MPSSGVQTCARSEEHTSELQSHSHLVCRLLLEKKIKSGERDSRRGMKVQHGCSAPPLLSKGQVSLFFKGSGAHRDLPSFPTRRSSDLMIRRPPRSESVVWGKSVDLGGRRIINDTATTEIYTLSLHDALPYTSVSS